MSGLGQERVGRVTVLRSTTCAVAVDPSSGWASAPVGTTRRYLRPEHRPGARSCRGGERSWLPRRPGSTGARARPPAPARAASSRALDATAAHSRPDSGRTRLYGLARLCGTSRSRRVVIGIEIPITNEPWRPTRARSGRCHGLVRPLRPRDRSDDSHQLHRPWRRSRRRASATREPRGAVTPSGCDAALSFAGWFIGVLVEGGPLAPYCPAGGRDGEEISRMSVLGWAHGTRDANGQDERALVSAEGVGHGE